VMVGLIYNVLETRMPKGGKLVVSEGELQLEVDTSSGKVQKDFAEIFDKRLKEANEWLGKRGIPLLPLNTSEGAALQVRHLLGYSPRTRRA